ncbi:MAG: histidine phosphatase family protein [Candidatus Woesearchaeota archaeon]
MNNLVLQHFYIVRHGDHDHSYEKNPLTTEGKQQIVNASKGICQDMKQSGLPKKIHIFTGPSHRTVQSAWVSKEELEKLIQGVNVVVEEKNELIIQTGGIVELINETTTSHNILYGHEQDLGLAAFKFGKDMYFEHGQWLRIDK